jgi:anthranilate synthase component 2
MIVLIDNYDSFVYNLARYFERLGQVPCVVRNDAATCEQIARWKPAAIVISPGPCTPSEAGISVELVRRFAGRVPLLGVCLGHQVIAAAFGGRVVRSPEPVHGRASYVFHEADPLFDGVPSPFEAARYHSLIVDGASLSSPLRAIAWSADGLIMAIRCAELPVWGVQFHPESVLTEHGYQILANFLTLGGIEVRADKSALYCQEVVRKQATLAVTKPITPVPF